MSCTHNEEVAECADIMCDVKRRIKEADAEGFKRGYNEGVHDGIADSVNCKEHCDEAYRRGVDEAEKAAGILAKQISWCADHCQTGDSCDCIDKAAECILSMEPEEKR